MSLPARHDDDRRQDGATACLSAICSKRLRARLDHKQWVVVTAFGIGLGAGTVRYADLLFDEHTDAV
jgi:hypothetical protein